MKFGNCSANCFWKSLLKQGESTPPPPFLFPHPYLSLSPLYFPSPDLYLHSCLTLASNSSTCCLPFPFVSIPYPLPFPLLSPSSPFSFPSLSSDYSFSLLFLFPAPFQSSPSCPWPDGSGVRLWMEYVRLETNYTADSYYLFSLKAHTQPIL